MKAVPERCQMLTVRSPAECCEVLPGKSKELIWQHAVLPCGAAGSVWAYLRVKDAICFPGIVRLVVAHFVDDSFMIEGESVIVLLIKEVRAALGFRVKKAKEKPPAATQGLLGVDGQ